jgi:hypothetical protein
MAVYQDKNAGWAIDYPLYASGNDTCIKSSDHNWYGGADGDDQGGDARWSFRNRARQVVWDAQGNTTSTISLSGLPNIKLSNPTPISLG